MGAETLYQIAKLLRTNDTIRQIDLEGNKLIRGEDKPNYKGTECESQGLMSCARL